MIVLPGVYHGNSRNELTTLAPHMTLRGSGRDSTKLTWDDAKAGACTDPTGGAANTYPGAIDNGDLIRNLRQFVMVKADGLEVSGITFDMNATEMATWHQATGRNRYDWDGDGIQSNWPGDPNSPANYRTARICGYPTSSSNKAGATMDLGSGIQGENYGDVYVHDCAFLNMNRNAINLVTTTDNHTKRRLIVTNNKFDGAGEHTIVSHLDDTEISGNDFRNCGSTSCILLVGDSARVQNNNFYRWTNAGVYREIGGSGYSYDVDRTNISGNTFYDDVSWPLTSTIREGGGAIVFNAGYHLDPNHVLVEKNHDLIVANNTITIAGSPQMTGISVQGVGDTAPASETNRFLVNGNIVTFDPQDRSLYPSYAATQVGAIQLRNIQGFAANDNYMDVTGDSTAANQRLTYGFWVDHANSGVFIGNSLTMRGSNMYGFLMQTLTNAQVSSLVIDDKTTLYGTGGTASQTVGIDQSYVTTNVSMDGVTLIGDGASGKTGVFLNANSDNISINHLTCNGWFYCLYSAAVAGKVNYARNIVKTGPAPAGFITYNQDAGALVVENAICRGPSCRDVGWYQGGNNGVEAVVVTGHGYDLGLDLNNDATIDSVSRFRFFDSTLPDVHYSRGVRFRAATDEDGVGYLDLKPASAPSGSNTLYLPASGTLAVQASGYGVLATHGIVDGTLTMKDSLPYTGTSTLWIPSPVTLTLKSLACRLSVVNASSGSYTFQVLYNDSPASPAIECVIHSTEQQCTDTTHSMSVAAGGKMQIQVIPSGVPPSGTPYACAVMTTPY
jgi:hypothetical protein